MSKFKLTTNQRFAVYMAFKGICQWCKEPVDFKASHIDHVIPESMLKKPDELNEILIALELDEDFNLNDYENWVPMHSYCNNKKNKKIYSKRKTGFIRDILDDCLKYKKEEQEIELKLDLEPEKAELMVQVQAAIDKSLLNIKELQDFILKSDIMDSEDEELDAIKKKLEEKIDYQAQKMTKGIINLVYRNTVEIITSILKGLDDWEMATISRVVLQKWTENPIIIRFYLKNTVNDNLSTLILVDPVVRNRQLIIRFIEDGKVLKTMIQNIEDGLDWEKFRKTLKGLYLGSMNEKIQSKS